MLLRQVRVVPLDGPIHTHAAAGDPVDVLISGGIITRIAPRVTPPPGVPVLDGDGRWLIPGLWDAHVHLGQWAAASRRLDLSGARSPEEALALVRPAVAEGLP